MAIAIFFAISLWQERDLLATQEAAPMFELLPLHLSFIDDVNTSSLASSSVAALPARPIYLQEQRSLIYFFAPWCSICKFSMSNLAHLEGKMPVVAIALDYSDEQEVLDFITGLDIDVSVLLGGVAVAQAYKIKAFPTYYIINAEGKIEKSSMGYSTELGLQIRASL
ncbi:TlpA disulfide reductase family protein [Neptunomonas japonica]|uniref:TlpA disulfide reductase family protein n=1 Tax=Neptunomonas japonica TaxID=417574 RepID=UPI0003F9F4D7|nr:TlpA disulfide reductase family protein [Neptunomonas japonica]